MKSIKMKKFKSYRQILREEEAESERDFLEWLNEDTTKSWLCEAGTGIKLMEVMRREKCSRR